MSKSKNKVSGFFIVFNEKGLHTRPSTELVKCASKFKSALTLKTPQLEVNAKSLLGILMLAASKGTRIKIEAEGDDAENAVQAILDLAGKKFNNLY